MPLLTACFELPIHAACLLQLPDGTVADFQTTHTGFTTAVRLLPSESWRQKGKDDPNWTTSVWAIKVDLTRDDPDDVPEVIERPDGTRDLTQQGAFLLSRLDDYKSAAREVANKVLDFFRYCLLTPSVRRIVPWDQALASPVWYNARGVDLGPSRVLMAQPVPGIRGELGVQKLTQDRLPALAQYLNASDEPPLELALLSDAQTAWFEDSFRRTVLELAICAEVMVKRRFLPQPPQPAPPSTTWKIGPRYQYVYSNFWIPSPLKLSLGAIEQSSPTTTSVSTFCFVAGTRSLTVEN